jgi:hypothetical protein
VANIAMEMVNGQMLEQNFMVFSTYNIGCYYLNGTCEK